MNHTAKVISAITMITGTKTAEILSASLAIGALVAPASLVILTIFISVDSSPTPSALTLTKPSFIIVAEITSSPTSFLTATLSPVIADSSNTALPKIIVPSTLAASPLEIRITSPFLISSEATVSSVSFPSLSVLILIIFLGHISRRPSMASLVFLLDFDSRYLPTETSVKIIPAESK